MFARLFFPLCLLLAGCGALNEFAETKALERNNDIERLRDRLREEVATYKPRKQIEFSDSVWIGSSARPFANSTGPLPKQIVGQKEVVLVSARALNLAEAGRKISEISGLPVFSEMGDAAANATAPLNFSGSMEDLLHQTAELFGAHWFYDDKLGTLNFTQMITRIFDFYAPPGNVAIASAVGSAGGGEGEASANSSISFSHEGNYDDWDTIEQAIEQNLAKGSHFSLSPASGKITITTTPPAMRRIASIIRDRNDYLTRQIHIAVQVLEVHITAEENYAFDPGNINFNHLFKKAFGTKLYDDVVTYQSNNQFGGNTNAPGLIFNFENGTNQTTEDNVRLVFDALSRLGKISVVTTADTRARNGRPVPIQSTATRSYVAETSVAINAESGTSEIELTADQFTTGLLMNIRPRILASEEIQLEVAMSLQSLNSLREFTAGLTRVEQPDISTRAFTQEIIIPNGATLLLSGLERNAADAQKSGTNSPNNLLLGGGRDSEAARTVIIVLMTPTIIKQ